MDRGFAARLYPAAAKEPSPTLTAIVQYPLENNARQRDGFTEKGASAALGSSGGSQQTAFTTLGVHAATSFETFGLPASVRGSLGWHHATGDTDATRHGAFLRVSHSPSRVPPSIPMSQWRT
ncbi:autotransporter outer membrane beta-barrel domain-containing protein [Rhizobium leguminosarum]|uniref:autotransporter outer membrane beta-barrel domain-containing protein n=1 Tax=Rhizobium leguminosarum TaxID=384 RepID=UPI0013F175D8|nr:autotransporter outer membrane beta-barrel domain-containing protein [Rhizobium leguminosarum]